VAGITSGRDNDVSLDMVGEGTEDRMGIAIVVVCRAEVFVQASDGFSYGVGGLSSAVFSAGTIVRYGLSNILQVAGGFGFYGFNGIGVNNVFEFLLFTEKFAHGLGVVEREAALLESPMTLDRDCLTCGRIDQGRQPNLFPVEFRYDCH